ncbi:hypothetical protein HDU79_009109 [Rhizoclosmatium sp. JEL0117]|nr:hypothetical protein HDU79_009109 [Rhizoclosmatium sp. JEL0117]
MPSKQTRVHPQINPFEIECVGSSSTSTASSSQVSTSIQPAPSFSCSSSLPLPLAEHTTEKRRLADESTDASNNASTGESRECRRLSGSDQAQDEASRHLACFVPILSLASNNSIQVLPADVITNASKRKLVDPDNQSNEPHYYSFESIRSGPIGTKLFVIPARIAYANNSFIHGVQGKYGGFFHAVTITPVTHLQSTTFLQLLKHIHKESYDSLMFQGHLNLKKSASDSHPLPVYNCVDYPFDHFSSQPHLLLEPKQSTSGTVSEDSNVTVTEADFVDGAVALFFFTIYLRTSTSPPTLRLEPHYACLLQPPTKLSISFYASYDSSKRPKLMQF